MMLVKAICLSIIIYILFNYPIFTRMSKPITFLQGPTSATQNQIKTQRLLQLKNILNFNLQAQQNLKSMRDQIKERMHLIQEYVGTYRLRAQFPNSTSLMSYLKFQRTYPKSYKDQERITQKIDSCMKLEEDFVKNLDESKKSKSKKKQINFSEMPNNPKEINFVQMAKNSGFNNGIQLYKGWIQSKLIKRHKEPYTRQEESRLIQRQQIYGDNWQKICQIFQNRPFEEIYYQFHNRINPKIINGRWTPRQSLMLIILLEHYGTKKWALIGQKMVVKSQLQVRERYCNIIDPNVGKDTFWTPQMQKKLLQIAPQLDFCWKNIAKLSIFSNKTDNCIWRKFRSLMIKKSNEEILQILPEGIKRGLAKKIINFKQIYDSRKRRDVQIINKGKFDPNQRARIHRETLSGGSIRSFDSINQINREKIDSNNIQNSIGQIQIGESQQPSYIHYT